MNRFFTLLLAASCLTAVGQMDYVPDSVLIDEGWSLVLEREGQQYWLFDEDREWEDARAMCEELGAYLYWPNSIEEHLDVWASVPSGDDGIHYWTAVHQDFNIVDCSDPHGGWAGPNEVPQQFFHWSAENPNNATGRESVVQFEYGDWGALWNDAPGQACDDGFNCTCRFSRIILERSDNLGCTDPLACNFEGQSLIEDGSCDYSCCPGPGCCGDGMFWDWNLGECVITNPSDSNFDGCVQLNDLLDLLSAYGDCASEESPWQCGDPLEYQGYDYATVQIGEQCWFAENLRSESYRNGDLMLSSLTDAEWSIATQGANAVYDDDPSYLLSFGRLYNAAAVMDPRSLCPSNWHVPSDNEWTTLELFLGMEEIETSDTGWRGENEGFLLKSETGWYENGNGIDAMGFDAKAAGIRYHHGAYAYVLKNLTIWSSSVDQSGILWYRHLHYTESGIQRSTYNNQVGFSVRCIKDTE